MALDQSILNSTKKMLLIDPDYTAFDPDVITAINSALSNVHDLGLGPVDGLMIEDETAVWDDLLVTPVQLGWIKTYVFLKVRMVFDPAQTSFLIEAQEKQIAELEWRMNVSRENDLPFPLVVVE